MVRALSLGILVILGSFLTVLPVEAMGLKSLADDTASICAGLNAVGSSLDLTAYPELQNAMKICKKFSPFSKTQSTGQGAADPTSPYSDDYDDSDDNNMDDQDADADTPTNVDTGDDSSGTSKRQKTRCLLK